jgi:vanillate O-demethylase ferredoxin subunit
VDRHLASRASQNALIHVSTETGTEEIYSFQDLHVEVQCMAAVLREVGVGLGDRVLIYMPMVPHALVAMLACARLGAIYSVVFGGFAAVSLASCIDNAAPKVIMSADAGSSSFLETKISEIRAVFHTSARPDWFITMVISTSNTQSGLSVRVARIRSEAQDIRSFELVSNDGSTLPSFSAGSHVDVLLPGGLTRQYSLCNDPTESHRYLIGVLRDANSRGGSIAMHNQVKEGDVLSISAPRNHFALAHDAKRHLLLAGGIGITPILCMGERLAKLGSDFEMHYCTRSRDRTAFYERILGSAGMTGHVRFHFDDGSDQQKLDIPALLVQPVPGTHLYVCGPKGFMDVVLSTARAKGWPEAQLHYEFFAGADTKAENDGSFEVQLASSGRIILVPADKSVVRALSDAGVHVDVSCEQGVCGTCLTRVLEGVPDHRDLYLLPDEKARNDQFTPCCSRSKSPQLILDL